METQKGLDVAKLGERGWPTLMLDRFIPRKETRYPFCGGVGDSRGSLKGNGEEKISILHRGSSLGSSRPWRIAIPTNVSWPLK
jgi:hypothetical protein